MKVYAVAYPFDKTWTSYASFSVAKKDALDRFITQEEYEDEEEDAPCFSKSPAKVYEVEVQLKRSVIAAIMNGKTPKPPTTETLVHEFRYRRGKIVVTNAKAVTEQENVG